LSRSGARRGRRRRPLGSRFLAAVILLLAALLVLRFLVADDGYPALLALRSDLRRMESEVADLSRENADLRRRILALRNDAYPIEKIAREELDFTAPGELIYLFPEELSRPGASGSGPGEGR
jgi:cell division protein FtsB